MSESERGLLTLMDAEKYGSVPPEAFAREIMKAGLAKSLEDVVLVGKILFSRAYMPSGEPAGFYLRAGQVMGEES